MPTTLSPPAPPPPTVVRFKPDGTPTPAMVEYEARLMQFFKALAAQIALA